MIFHFFMQWSLAMITSFKIKNFRLFDELKINKLSRVNLIVGKNNSGKSALLEALLLFFSKMSPTDLVDIIYARQENLGSRRSTFSRNQAVNPVRHFFKNHKLPYLFDEGFILSSSDYSFEVKLAGYIREEREDDRFVRRPITKEEFNSKTIVPDLDEIFLVVDDGNQFMRILSLNDEFRDITRRIFFKKNRDIIFQYVPTSGLSNTKASLLWDSISLTDLENEVVKGLQLIEPSTAGITFVDSDEGRSREGRIPIVKINDVDEPIPLKSLGDGMTRMFHIILSLVCAKDGVLIVDEFENGLHWSVQEGAWDIVFKLAKSLNVQVFTTTHSRDCITSFERAWGLMPEDGAFMRVSKDNGHSSLKEYDIDLLRDSIDTDVEIR